MRTTLAILVLALCVTSCTTGGGSRVTHVPTPSTDPHREYLAFIREKAPPTSGVVATSDERLLELGSATCDGLRGSSKLTPAGVSNSYDLTLPGAGATIVAAALIYVCPELSGRADD